MMQRTAVLLAVLSLCRGQGGEEEGQKCPVDFQIFGNYTCHGLTEWYKKSSAGELVYSTVTATSSENCDSQIVTCNIFHTLHGHTTVTDIYNRSTLCDTGLVVTQRYDIKMYNESSQENSSFRVAQTTAFPYSGRVPHTTPLGLVTDAPQEYLRVQMRGGELNRESGTLKGFFAMFELSTDAELLFQEWMLLSYEKYSCNRGWLHAGYTLYHDTQCLVKSDYVDIIRPDGFCYFASKQPVAGDLTQPGGLGIAALCEDGRLYFSNLFPSISSCAANISSTFQLKREASSISYDHRGVCLTDNVTSIKFDADTCQKEQNQCVWKKGKVGGTRYNIGTNLTMEECYNSYVTAGFTQAPCGIAWSESGVGSPTTRCFYLADSCVAEVDSTELNTGGAEWTCILRSAASPIEKASQNNLVLEVLIVVLGVCCVVFVAVLLRVICQYQRRLRMRPDRGVHDVDSGRTDGVVHGVPVPTERQLEHDEDDDDACSAGPTPDAATPPEDTERNVASSSSASPQTFHPDPNVTANPLQNLASPQGAVQERPSRRSLAAPSSDPQSDGEREERGGEEEEQGREREVVEEEEVRVNVESDAEGVETDEEVRVGVA